MNKHWGRLARVAISGILMWLVYQHIDPARLRSLFAHGQMAFLPLIFLLMFSNTVLNCTRWQAFLATNGHPAPLSRLVPSMLIAGFLNTFLPSVVGGDVYRVYDLADKFSKTESALASVIASRLSGYMALSMMGIGFGLMGISLLPHPAFVLLPVGAFCALAVALWLFLHQRILYALLKAVRLDRVARINAFVEKFLGVFAIYRKNPGVFFGALGVGLVFQCLVIVCIYLMAQTMRLDVPFFDFCVFVPMISLIEMVPLTIFGLGLRDGAYVLFFGMVGLPREDALSMAIFYVILTIAYSLIGGALLWLRVGRRRTGPHDTP